MSFLTDVFEGNFDNLGHDLTAHPTDYIGPALGALGIASGGFGLPALFGAEGAAAGGEGLFSGLGSLFGGGGADAAATAGADAAGGALGFGADTSAVDPALSSFLGNPAEAAGGAGGGFGPSSTAFDSVVGQGPSSPDALFPGYGTGGAGGAPGGVSDPSALFPGYGSNAPGPAGAATTAGDSSGGGLLSKLVTGATDQVTKNPLGIAAAGAGLGLNLLKGNPTDPNAAKLQEQANQLGAQGAQLQQYLSNGTLPPAMKASLDQATKAAKARIISNAAANGQSTNPSQNSALAQELSAVDTNAVAAMASAQIQMMQQGLSATGLSSQLYDMLVKMDRQNNQDLMSAISSFASALGGGGGKTTTLKLS